MAPAASRSSGTDRPCARSANGRGDVPHRHQCASLVALPLRSRTCRIGRVSRSACRPHALLRSVQFFMRHITVVIAVDRVETSGYEWHRLGLGAAESTVMVRVSILEVRACSPSSCRWLDWRRRGIDRSRASNVAILRKWLVYRCRNGGRGAGLGGSGQRHRSRARLRCGLGTPGGRTPHDRSNEQYRRFHVGPP